MPELGDWTPSDSGPWLTIWDEEWQTSHVVPDFGPGHRMSLRCWCHPILQDDGMLAVVSHNVGH